jgi:hypothetical protein
MIKPCGSACAVSKMKILWFKRKEEKEMRDISNIVAVDDRYLDRSVCVLQLQRCSPQVRLTRTFGMRESHSATVIFFHHKQGPPANHSTTPSPGRHTRLRACRRPLPRRPTQQSREQPHCRMTRLVLFPYTLY